MLANLPIALETVALEHRQGGVVQERAGDGDLPANNLLWIAVHQAATEPCDLLQRARERYIRDCSMPVRAPMGGLGHGHARWCSRLCSTTWVPPA